MCTFLQKNFLVAFASLTLFTFVLPHCLTVIGTPEIKLAVYNMELSAPTGECYFESGCSFTGLSCRYLSYLNKSIIQGVYDDLESAKFAVEQGHAWGAMYFTDNFTDALVARIALDPEDVDEETIEQSEIHVWLDTSNKQAEIDDLKATYGKFANELLKDCDVDSNDPQSQRLQDVNSILKIENLKSKVEKIL